MPIPRVIYQTYKTEHLPLINRWYIDRFRKRNPDYRYEFYDDLRIEAFLKNEYPAKVLDAYKRIRIGAAKADFFRYAVLYKKGGIYIDIDSNIPGQLSTFILPTDSAIISKENHGNCYVQWALIYEAGHPFLNRTLELILQNIEENKFIQDVLNFSGPNIYTRAINECLHAAPDTKHRLCGSDYNGQLTYHLPANKYLYFFQFNNRRNHWTEQQKKIKVFE